MEAVVFEGKEYIKASVLATRFRYTADYLGQLCRGKKVDARLVGRAWYINLDSLNQHRSGRYKTTSPKEEVAEISPKKPSNHYLSRIDVEPVLRKKTVSLVKATRGSLTELPVKYERDDYSLIPRFNEQAVSKDIRITQADAENLGIQKVKSPITAFKAEALPEVYLKGAIKVAGLEEANEGVLEPKPEADDKKEPKIKIRRMPEPAKPTQVMVRQLKRPVIIPAQPAVKIPPANRIKVSEVVDSKPLHHDTQKLILPVPAHSLAEIPRNDPKIDAVAKKANPNALRIDMVRDRVTQPNFKPQAVVHGEAIKAKKQESSAGWYSVFFTLALAVGLAVWILGTRAEISVDGGRHVEHWKFDVAELRERL